MECHYAECLIFYSNAESRIMIVVILNVIMLSVIVLTVTEAFIAWNYSAIFYQVTPDGLKIIFL
jgi:hypothetical protein